VIISEVAWAGTRASPNDEWIELYNTRPFPINITGWRLTTASGSVDHVLNGVIPANGFFLLERAYDLTVSDIPADQIFIGQLADTDEILRLRNTTGQLIDTANANGGTWPAGGGTNAASMERIINGGVVAPDNNSGWMTNTGAVRNGRDAAGNDIFGTPRSINWAFIVTPTFTPVVTATATAPGVRSVIINEIAWAGTASGLPNDEWIELYNPGSVPINITGWRLTAADSVPNIVLSGIVPAGGYFLLERGDDNVVSDITADQIYSGALANTGETLTLYDAANRVIDTANGNGGPWPAGSATTYGTMERILNTADSDTAWITNNGTKRNGINRNGGNILGTPKQSNTIGPTPTPQRPSTPTATATLPINPRPIINEILARPGFDWNQDGKVDVRDEFIEIKNVTPIEFSLSSWRLDILDGTSFSLPNVRLAPGQRIVFYGLQTNLLLSDGGATIRLIDPGGRIFDAFTYTLARSADQSFCRLPDESSNIGTWYEDCIPTPALFNTREGRVPTMPGGGDESALCDLPDTIPNEFYFAECHGYGANIWNSYYWDRFGWQGAIYIKQNTSKFESIIE
jgi:hypothetical protein